MKRDFEEVSDEEFTDAFKKSYRFAEIAKILGFEASSNIMKKIKKRISKLDLDVGIIKANYKEHFFQTRVCPVCGKSLLISKKIKQICCSRGCANTFFRSGKDNPNYKEDAFYTTKCFRFHEHKCIICGESRIVCVHHYDQNHNNNDMCNFVPLCPTHHSYIHSKFKTLIQDKVDEYVRKFREKFNES